MKTTLKTLSLYLLLTTPLIAQAAPSHEDQCAIWLCLPGGFPEGCGAARNAMNWRIEHHHSPLPPFSSCAINYDSNGDGKDDFIVQERRVILINKQLECIMTRRRSQQNCKSLAGQYEARPGSTCWKIRPTKDNDGVVIPGCVGVFREMKILDTINKQTIGKTFYWNKSSSISL